LIAVNFGILNLILAVIVDSACEARQEDTKRILADKEKSIKDASVRLMQMCEDMDIDKDGCLSDEEIRNGYETNAEFSDLMKLMDVAESDLAVVMEIMDSDKDGKISYEEFCSQLYKMKTQDQHTVMVLTKHLASHIALLSRQLLTSVNEIARAVTPLGSDLSPDQCERPGMYSGLERRSNDAEPLPPKTTNNNAHVFPRSCAGFGQGALSTTPGLKSIQGLIDCEVHSELEMLRQRIEKDLALSMTEFANRAWGRSNVNPCVPIQVPSHDMLPRGQEDLATTSPQQLPDQVRETIDGQVDQGMVAPSVTATRERHDYRLPALSLSSHGIPECFG